ncbi:MAG: GAF domain-containing protein [Myxococcota bacterium]
MPTKRWKLVVTDLGGGEPLSEATTEGDNWMQALTAGRAALGESGAVPPGASCVPGADGGVTVLDPQQRRRYVLRPVEAVEGSSTTRGSAPSATQEKKKKLRQTVAYMPAPDLGAEPPSEGSSPRKTVAFMPSPLAPDGARPAKEVVVGDASEAVGPPAGSRSTPGGSDAPPTELRWELLAERDEEPSKDNPLRYRERIFLAPEGTGPEEAEEILRSRFEALRQELAEAPPGKFFNLAVFDHRWTDEPARPPLVTLEWKDWRGDPVVEHPSARPSSAPSTPPVGDTGEHDARLMQAFEACQDLLFLESPALAVHFAVHLLGELMPCEAITACLYDIDADEQRVVVATGTGGDAMQGRGLPSRAGLMGAAAEALGPALRVDDVGADGRFDPEAEGRPGLEPRSALYAPLAHQGQLLGMLQLLDRTGQPHFDDTDVEVLGYVAGQLAEFVHHARSGA